MKVWSGPYIRAGSGGSVETRRAVDHQGQGNHVLTGHNNGFYFPLIILFLKCIFYKMF